MNKNLHQQNEKAESDILQDISQHRSIVAILSGLPLMVPGIFVAVFMIGGLFFFMVYPSFEFLLLLSVCIGAMIPSGWLLVYQYCALFCCKPIFVRAYHEVYLFLAFFCLLGAIVNFLEYVFKNEKSDPNLLIFLGCLFLVGIICLCVGIVNYKMTSYRHKIFISHGINKNEFETKPFSVHEYKMRTILGLVVMFIIIVIAAAILSCYDLRYHPPIGKHLSYEQLPRSYFKDFPPTGRDYSFHRKFHNAMYCEFTISEEEFRRWIASDERWRCRSIEQQYQFRPLKNSISIDFKPPTNGLYAEQNNQHAVFDSSTNRVYYWAF
ncbi:MAG: hypothetical protein LBC20_01480 [Planctomycetaceae bacterium]|jgi:hypothetical protein|nr:hypothetical protein [Planctomycetaceae bacterium]